MLREVTTRCEAAKRVRHFVPRPLSLVRSGRSGVAATEFAFVCPLLMLLGLACADFGRISHHNEVVANAALGRVRFGLDYFDASINRVAAWVIGARNLLRALLLALLEPPGLRSAERRGDNTARLALQEEARAEDYARR